ncbi:hypothetical protein DOTSEDRAFT_54528 [Dothistroma septosporum NZE10]|uniref:F-box domain-containing protein n=1 Tax=Dothistroma septosporum (strain NZE10 / CBS 128990) TaxID=675120 RepID=N1PKI0_DOTSN|nr:hypothetical protein DOTSEDRAFT_54528 [Dothistroma septosporum NZE10]
MAPSPGEPKATALNIIELLEKILLQLLMQDRLLDQCVDKAWKSCVEKSSKLQKALFSVADGEPTLCLEGCNLSTSTLDKYLLPRTRSPQRLPGALFFGGAHSDQFDYHGYEVAEQEYELEMDHFIEQQWICHARTLNLVGTTIHPLLVKAFGIEELAWRIELGPNLVDLDKNVRGAEASWRRMLMCQPPLPNLYPCEGAQRKTSQGRNRRQRVPAHLLNNSVKAHDVLVRVLEVMDTWK